MIVIARNPIDVIPSFALLKNTNSHSLTINEEWHEAFPDFWDSFVTVIVDAMKKNHEAVINIAGQIPTYFMRYEDLKMRPQPVLEEMFRFLLDAPSIEDTIVQKRIAELTQ